MTEEQVKQGWGFPGASRKAHYFTESARSLCGAWMFTGKLTKDTGKSSPDDCGQCTRQLKKMQETKAKKKDTKDASEAQKAGEGDQQNSPGHGG